MNSFLDSSKEGKHVTNEAWKDLVDSLYKLCFVAEEYKVTLVF